jgi:hypothetical protein
MTSSVMQFISGYTKISVGVSTLKAVFYAWRHVEFRVRNNVPQQKFRTSLQLEKNDNIVTCICDV